MLVVAVFCSAVAVAVLTPVLHWWLGLEYLASALLLVLAIGCECRQVVWPH